LAAASIGAVSANMTVVGIHVVVTITMPLADAGTQIYVGYATSSLSEPVRGLLGGVGYGQAPMWAETSSPGRSSAADAVTRRTAAAGRP